MIRLLPKTGNRRLLREAIADLAHVTTKGCWELRPRKGSRPRVRIDGKQVRLYRLTYRLWRGPLRLNACHTCDNAWCFSPYHIKQGTQGQNLRDGMHRGRSIAWRHRKIRPQRGSMHWSKRNPERWEQHLRKMIQGRR